MPIFPKRREHTCMIQSNKNLMYSFNLQFQWGSYLENKILRYIHRCCNFVLSIVSSDSHYSQWYNMDANESERIFFSLIQLVLGYFHMCMWCILNMLMHIPWIILFLSHTCFHTNHYKFMAGVFLFTLESQWNTWIDEMRSFV